MLTYALQNSCRSVEGCKLGAGMVRVIVEDGRTNGEWGRLSRGATGGLKEVMQGVDGRTGWLDTPASLEWALVSGPSRLTIVFGCVVLFQALFRMVGLVLTVRALLRRLTVTRTGPRVASGRTTR
uniref:Uncharacterized protein n=1 Tax=Chromera velia CCMP2878 TaxID=1169474 RepID=A0A0G4HVD5_9ALVE|eukprot:Cvel_8802.t1-p1 / transcript=Cvel_8802.t1 / gene=Cvel_8802 / organism=Chromera_velia_CCMP2878 / gene_product=hypothetical protein / transcript_product=hypothetical protein / location=Cvel_scaffold493:28647-30682(-) / protein_length=124 / sequence_SO=supercontig / SO=protein_coding / is_pseudo=false